MSLKNYLHRGRTVTHSPGNYKSNYLEDAENGIGISECLAGPQGMDFHIWVPDIFKDDPILDNLITDVASKLLEVFMSKVQFTEMITSLNANSVPCTLQYINGERLGNCPEVNQREILQKDFENQLEELKRKIVVMEEAVKQVVNKPAPTKFDKQNLASSVQQIKQEIQSNLPYIRKCYDESIEKSLSLAKLELETCAKSLGYEPSKTPIEHVEVKETCSSNPPYLKLMWKGKPIGDVLEEISNAK